MPENKKTTEVSDVNSEMMGRRDALELSELKRKITEINGMAIAIKTLENDKQLYISSILKSHNLNQGEQYSIDLDTGLISR